MMTLFPICIILGALCVSLLSAEPVENVSVEVGSTIVLPCKLKSVGPETLYIKWIKESNMVFERKPDNGEAGEGYEGRVDVPVEELRKGNCSLVLRNLTLNDTGVYTNIQLVPRIKRSVTREFKKISSVSLSVRGDAGMKCPHPIILHLSLLFCVFFQFFSKEP